VKKIMHMMKNIWGSVKTGKFLEVKSDPYFFKKVCNICSYKYFLKYILSSVEKYNLS